MAKTLLDRSNLTQENQDQVAVCLNTAIKKKYLRQLYNNR